MKMKKEKDIVKFFNRYSEQMLPEDGEQFMEKLKRNMELLPVPSSFNEMDPEISKEYSEWLLAKLKKDYKRSKKDAIISCIFTSILIIIAFLVISALGVLDINILVTVSVLAAVALASITLLYSLLPFHTKELF